MAKRSKGGNWPVVVLVVAAVGVVAWWLWPSGGDDTPETPTTNPAVTNTNGSPKAPNGTPIPRPAMGPGRTVVRTDAVATFRRGMALMAGPKLLEARTELSAAYNSGGLGHADAERARDALTQLANQTLFHPGPYVNPRDPYLLAYTYKAGEYLENSRDSQDNPVRGIISRNGLWVPARAIVEVNGLASDRVFQAGRKYKMLRGPFHAIVRKSRRVMDVYLQDLFVRRIPICVGATQTPTPEGRFVVSLGGKSTRTDYTPPVGRGTKVLKPGDPDYPLDPMGHNIKLEGRPGTDYSMGDGYAIHGTNDPSSMGKAMSLGCVRVGPANIAWVFARLYESKSFVTILP